MQKTKRSSRRAWVPCRNSKATLPTIALDLGLAESDKRGRPDDTTNFSCCEDIIVNSLRGSNSHTKSQART